MYFINMIQQASDDGVRVFVCVRADGCHTLKFTIVIY